MKNKEELTETGFSKRFKQFMSEFNLNSNRLAIQMSGTDDESVVKKSRVKYGRWANGEVDPAYEGLCEIAAKYGVSIDWLALGEGEMMRTANQAKPSADYIDWKSRFEALEKKYDDLFKEYRDFVQSVTQKMKMSFNPSSSQTTAKRSKHSTQPYSMGFKIRTIEKKEGKVISMHRQQVIRRLNSLTAPAKMQA